MSSTSLALIVLATLLPTVQDLAKPERGRLRGRVLDVAGKPWAAAKVIISTRGIADFPGFGDADKLVVTTDDQGRFVAQLLPCRVYSAWAMADIGKKRYRATSYYEKVSAGQILELREEGVFEQARILVSGLELYRDLGPFSIEALRRGTPSYGEIMPVEKDGEYLCPPMPGGYRSHHLLAKKSARLFSRSTTFRVIDPNTKVPAQAAIVLKTLKPGPDIVLHIKSRATGKGLAGARVYTHLRGELYPLSTSDSEGFVVLPFQGPRYQVLREGKYSARLNLVVMARGHATTMFNQSVSLARGRKAELQLRQKQPDVSITLDAGRTVKGRILLAEGKPASRMTLAIYTALLRAPRNSLYHWRWPMLFKTDHEGRFDISGLNAAYVYRLLAAPNAEERRSLSRSRSYSTLPVVWLAGGPAPAQKGLDLGDIHFDKLPALDVRVRSFDAAPAESATLVLGEAGLDSSARRALLYGVILSTDRRGRVRLFARRGSSFAMASSHAGGQGLISVAPKDLSVAGSAVTMDLELSPTVRFRV